MFCICELTWTKTLHICKNPLIPKTRFYDEILLEKIISDNNLVLRQLLLHFIVSWLVKRWMMYIEMCHIYRFRQKSTMPHWTEIYHFKVIRIALCVSVHISGVSDTCRQYQKRNEWNKSSLFVHAWVHEWLCMCILPDWNLEIYFKFNSSWNL